MWGKEVRKKVDVGEEAGREGEKVRSAWRCYLACAEPIPLPMVNRGGVGGEWVDRQAARRGNSRGPPHASLCYSLSSFSILFSHYLARSLSACLPVCLSACCSLPPFPPFALYEELSRGTSARQASVVVCIALTSTQTLA